MTQAKGLVPFRVFFADGTSFDVTAPNPAIARSSAKDAHPKAVITKVKVMKGEDA